jgi:hypothetical protein
MNFVRQFRVEIAACIMLVLVSVILFWNVHGFEFFVIDDNNLVYRNPAILAGLQSGSLSYAFNPEYSYFIPITVLSFMLDTTLFGTGPGGYHIMNVFYHIVSTLGLFLGLRYMTGSVWRSLFVACLFAFHPMHIEAVAWVSGRKDTLYASFWFLSILAYGVYVRKRTIPRYLLVFGLLLLSMLSKPMAITLPCVFMLLDFWPLNRYENHELTPKTVWKLFVEKIPFFAVLFIIAVVTMMTVTDEAVRTAEEVTYRDRAVNVPTAYVVYIWKTFFPFELYAPGYRYPVGAPIWQACLAVLGLGAVTYGVWWRRKREPMLIVGWLWFLGTFVPIIGIIAVSFNWRADRYSYVPLVGLFIMAWPLFDIAYKKWSKHTVSVIVALAIVCSSLAFSSKQLTHWRDSRAMFIHFLSYKPNDWYGLYQLGRAYREGNEFDESIQYYVKSLEQKPHFNTLLALGYSLFKLERYADAERATTMSIELMPGRADSYVWLARAQRMQGKIDAARASVETGLSIESNNRLLLIEWQILGN